MRNPLIRLLLSIAVLAAPFTAASACAGTGCAAASVLASTSSGCGGSGGGTPQPQPKSTANVIQAECTRAFEGPDNYPGKVEAYVSFSCPFHVESATLTIAIYHSGSSAPLGPKPEASHTCFSIEEGICTVTVACTEGKYRASFNLSAIVDGKDVTDFDVSNAVTYSAGDCSV